ncbi:hypothetical protein Tco_0694628, partial [Tanacetum coccineum]
VSAVRDPAGIDSAIRDPAGIDSAVRDTAGDDDFEVLMKGEFEMSAMGEMNFFLGLQV